MRPVYWWVTAILMAALSLCRVCSTILCGVLSGRHVATDSCSSLPGASLFVAGSGLAGVVLATALPAPVLIVGGHAGGWSGLPGGLPGQERLLLYQLAPIVVAGV